MHVEAELDEDDSDCWSSDAEVVSEKKEKIIIILDPLDFSKTPEIYPLPKYIYINTYPLAMIVPEQRLVWIKQFWPFFHFPKQFHPHNFSSK